MVLPVTLARTGEYEEVFSAVRGKGSEWKSGRWRTLALVSENAFDDLDVGSRKR